MLPPDRAPHPRRSAAVALCLSSAPWLAGLAAAQPTPSVELRALRDFPIQGGAVLAVDVAADGRRAITLGEFDDAVIWEVEGRELARADCPGTRNVRYIAMHPTRAAAVVCVDRFASRGADHFELVYVGAADRPDAPAVQQIRREFGVALALAWNAEGSLLAVGRVSAAGSAIDIFAPSRTGLAPIESLQVAAVSRLVRGGAKVAPQLLPFVGRWRYHADELAGDPTLGRREVVAEGELWRAILDHTVIAPDPDRAVPDPVDGGLLVADANPRLARHLGGVGVGIDEIGQVFTQRDKQRVALHAFNAGPALAIAFTPDGKHVGVASRAAVTIAAIDGGAPQVVRGKHLLAAGSGDDELVLLRHGVRTYRAATGAITEGPALPVAHHDAGEGDASVATMPQLRSFTRLSDGRLVLGAYSEHGHDVSVIDLAAHTRSLAAGSHRDSNGTRINVRQIAQLTGTQWVAREYVKASRGEFRRLSVLRSFDGGREQWHREFHSQLIALATAPDGATLLVADEDGGLTPVAAATGERGARCQLERPVQWVAYRDAQLALAHDGVDLLVLTPDPPQVLQRMPLPAGQPITATALSRDGTKLAFGRGPRAHIFALTITAPTGR